MRVDVKNAGVSLAGVESESQADETSTISSVRREIGGVSARESFKVGV